jgi:hypothetical protein
MPVNIVYIPFTVKTTTKVKIGIVMIKIEMNNKQNSQRRDVHDLIKNIRSAVSQK